MIKLKNIMFNVDLKAGNHRSKQILQYTLFTSMVWHVWPMKQFVRMLLETQDITFNSSISKININDSPSQLFKAKHGIRVLNN